MPQVRRQSGYATQWFLLGLVGLLFGLSVGYLRAQDHERLNRADLDRAAYLRDAADRLQRWYASNSAATGAQAGQVDMVAALAAAGVVPRYNLQAASSERLTDGLVAWHTFALWLPEPLRVAGTDLDPLTGVFTQGVLVGNGQPAQIIHAVLNGHGVQLRLFAETGRRAREIAARLENRFAAMRATHPIAPEANWFRAQDCAAVQADELPCIDAYQDLATTALPAAVGLSPLNDTNTWGGAFQVSNRTDSSAVSPFTMSIRTALPWGGEVRAQAQEP